MNRRIRLTFLYNQSCRSSVAALLASVEDLVDDDGLVLRIVNADEASRLDFDSALSEYLCISAMTETWEAWKSITKRLVPVSQVTLICGGPHPSGAPEEALRAGFHYCCVGEGEHVIRSIALGEIEDRRRPRIKGLFWMESDELRGDEQQEHVRLGQLPPLPLTFSFPAYIEAGRGCRWQCSYCQTPRLFGSRERFRSPDLIEAVARKYSAFGMKDFRLIMPNALGYMSDDARKPNCEALKDLLERLSRVSPDSRVFLGSFPSEVRADYITEEALLVLKQYVANTKIVIGAQSGSERMLSAMRRGHTVGDIKRACRIARNVGFVPSVDIMLGFPGEEESDRQATFELIEWLGSCGATVNMHFFMPLPGTPVENATPSFLSDKDRRRIDRFAQRGIVRGRWRKQEEIARQWVLHHQGKSQSR